MIRRILAVCACFFLSVPLFGSNQFQLLEKTGKNSHGTAISNDGKTVVGYLTTAGVNTGTFVWTAINGMASIGEGALAPNGVSSDGTVIVGQSTSASQPQFFRRNGTITLFGDAVHHGLAYYYTVCSGVSPDGTFAFGAQPILTGNTLSIDPYRLPLGGTMDLLPVLSGDNSYVLCSSDSGGILGGQSPNEGFPVYWESGDIHKAPMIPKATGGLVACVTPDGSILGGQEWTATEAFGFLYWPSTGKMVTFKGPGGAGLNPLAHMSISNDGSIVCGAYMTGPVSYEGFVYNSKTGVSMEAGDYFKSYYADPGTYEYCEINGVSGDGRTFCGTLVLSDTQAEAFYASTNLDLASVSTAESQIQGGLSMTGTVTLTRPVLASEAPYVVELKSSAPKLANVPASISFGSGIGQETFKILTTVVAANSNITITAWTGTAEFTAQVTVLAPVLKELSLQPVYVIGGQMSIGTIWLTKGMATGLVVNLSGSSLVSIPTSVTVGVNDTSATFKIASKPVAVNTDVVINATAQGITKDATLVIEPPALYAFTVDPTTVIGGRATTGTVNISGPAPTDGIWVGLTSSVPSAATPPEGVTVASGATREMFSIVTHAVNTPVNVSISATRGAYTKSAVLTVNPAALVLITPSVTSVAAGKSFTVTVLLNGPSGPAGDSVGLSLNSAATAGPASVKILAGAVSASATVTTKPVAANTLVKLTSTFNGITVTCSITVTK